MLKINKEFLRELLKENFRCLFGCSHSTEIDFSDESREFIIYTSITKVVSGNSCWEDSKEDVDYTDAHYITESTIGEVINSFIIQEHEFSRYNIDNKNLEQICDYYDHYFIPDYRFHQFIYTDQEEIDRDYYGNHSVSRIMKINIEEILDYILNNPYSKPIEELHEHLTELSLQDINRIKNTPFIMQSILNDELEENDISKKKLKI